MNRDRYQVAAGTEDVPRQRPGPSQEAVDSTAYRLLEIVRTVRARERGRLAAVLHDGPVQELAAATLGLSLAGRAAGDGLAVAEGQVEAAGRSLRRLLDELAPVAGAGRGLTEALTRRTAWLLAAPLAVNLGEGASGLSAAEVEAVADLAELMLLGAAEAEAPARALVTVRADRGSVVVELDVSATGDPAAAVAWLDRLAAAMRTAADVGGNGQRLRASIGIPRY